ncbi:MAG: transcriptional regulator [Deltaproteobacteria bacterium]|nr:transcriptional regulator [Deltaproteobacteria bacterium]
MRFRRVKAINFSPIGLEMSIKSKRFSDKIKKLHRLLAILRMLDNRECCTRKSLAEKFNVSIKSIERDISDLNLAGFSIVFVKEENTYRFTDPDYTLRDLNLNKDELAFMLIGRQFAHNLGKPFEKACQSLLRKAYKDTGIKTRERIKGAEEKSHFWVDMGQMEEFEKVEKQYNAINEAMDRKQEIEILYKAMEDQKETRRTIAPYVLFFHEGLWYVIGHCHLRNEIRFFAMDCIKEIKVTNEPYIIPDDFDINEHFKRSWGMRRYGAPVEVALKFSERYSRWIKRRKWHPTQVIEEQKDGSIIFKVKVEGTVELKWWTYHWIPFCEILAPPELKKEVMEEMKTMLGVYGKNA